MKLALVTKEHAELIFSPLLSSIADFSRSLLSTLALGPDGSIARFFVENVRHDSA
jgi:hypothetical protein